MCHESTFTVTCSNCYEYAEIIEFNCDLIWIHQLGVLSLLMMTYLGMNFQTSVVDLPYVSIWPGLFRIKDHSSRALSNFTQIFRN